MKQKIFLTVIILVGIVSNIFPQTLFRSGIFLHHSTGGCIWSSPDNLGTTSIPDEMTAYNIAHGYTGNDAIDMIGAGSVTWFPLGVAGNEWELWHRIFDGYTGDGDIQPYLNNNNIIVIKSCYPSSVMDNVGSPSDTLTPTIKSIYNYKWHWRNIVRVMEQHPDNFFAIWTNAPYRGGNGELSHQFCKWAKDTLATGNDPIFGDFPDNVYVFDFFHKLASEGSNWWLPDSLSYWNGSGFESHPNGRATDLVAPLFVQEIFDAAINYETGIETFQLSLPVQNGWNIVSIPGLHPINQNVSTWWMNRSPSADVFSYSGGYQSVTSLSPGTGYWMKHSDAQTYNTGDEWPAGGIQLVAHNPINGEAGWNLFGGYELSVTTANITTVPPGLISGLVYKYAGGYQIANTLDPGYGYWMKLTGAGQIIIPGTLAKGTKPVEYIKEDWGKIIITDNTGKHYILYGVKGEVNLYDYELPPAPPAGMFDVRYESGRFAEDLNGHIKTVEINGIEYPVTIKVENMSIKIWDKSSKIVNETLKTGQEVIINSSLSKLLVSGEVISDKYLLEQNYPNPFNPNTTISWQSPVDIWQTLKVYDILGNEVATLVDEFKSAGRYEVEFDASLLSSGLYFYKLKAGNYIDTKKMILLK